MQPDIPPIHFASGPPVGSELFALFLYGRPAAALLCHRDFLGCTTCLQRIAQFLAREIRFDLQAALNRPAAQYQAEVCGQLEHGHELRRRTVEACFLHRPGFGDFAHGTTADEIVIADDFATMLTAPELEVCA